MSPLISDFQTLSDERRPYWWIKGPIERACEEVRRTPVFTHVDSMRNPKDFQAIAEQFCLFSPGFVKAMGVMLSQVRLDDSELISVLAQHIHEEASHPRMLVDWMVRQGLFKGEGDLKHVVPTTESSAFLDFLLRLGAEGDAETYLCALNFGIERCSHDFFGRVAERMNFIGAGHEYFDLHGTVDVAHSSLGENLVAPFAGDLARAVQIQRKVLQGISLWTAALHAPIGIKLLLDFNPNGTLKLVG